MNVMAARKEAKGKSDRLVCPVYLPRGTSTYLPACPQRLKDERDERDERGKTNPHSHGL